MAAEQRNTRVCPGKERFDQLQIADRDSVEHQAILPLVEADAIDVVERAALRGTDVVKDCSRCGSCRGFACQSEAFERQHAKMIFKQRDRVIGSKDPVVQRSLRRIRWMIEQQLGAAAPTVEPAVPPAVLVSNSGAEDPYSSSFGRNCSSSS